LLLNVIVLFVCRRSLSLFKHQQEQQTSLTVRILEFNNINRRISKVTFSLSLFLALSFPESYELWVV